MSKPLELVRVKDPNGGEMSMSRQHAKNRGLQILEGKPTRDKYGRPIPAKSDPLRKQDGDVPTESSTHADIDAYAAARGVDLAGASTKSDKLAAIAAAANTQEA